MILAMVYVFALMIYRDQIHNMVLKQIRKIFQLKETLRFQQATLSSRSIFTYT